MQNNGPGDLNKDFCYDWMTGLYNRLQLYSSYFKSTSFNNNLFGLFIWSLLNDRLNRSTQPIDSQWLITAGQQCGNLQICQFSPVNIVRMPLFAIRQIDRLRISVSQIISRVLFSSSAIFKSEAKKLEITG